MWTGFNTILFLPVSCLWLFWLCRIPSVLFMYPCVARGCFWFSLVCWLWLPWMFLLGREFYFMLVGHHSRSLLGRNMFLLSMALPARSRPWSLIQFRNHFSQTVGLLGRVINPSQGPYLNRGQHKHRINAYTHQTSIPRVGFKSTIPASERAKTVHALDRTATVTGWPKHVVTNKGIWRKNSERRCT
jgi:hypothetical protein